MLIVLVIKAPSRGLGLEVFGAEVQLVAGLRVDNIDNAARSSSATMNEANLIAGLEPLVGNEMVITAKIAAEGVETAALKVDDGAGDVKASGALAQRFSANTNRRADSGGEMAGCIFKKAEELDGKV